jgi:hemerythrin-like domain-containing protein
MLEEHHEHEERSIFPHVRTSEPEMVAELEAQHEEVRRLLAATSEAVAATRAAAADSGAAEQAAHLNRRFNDLAAYFLTHLAHEEAAVLPASQAHFSDPELAAMQQEIMGNIPPERYADWMRLMLGALSRAELTGMFAGMKASAPPEALEGMKKMAAGIVGEVRWTAIARDAGL